MICWNSNKLCIVLGESPSLISFKRGGAFRCRSGQILREILPDNFSYFFTNIHEEPINSKELFLNIDQKLVYFKKHLNNLINQNVHLLSLGNIPKYYLSLLFEKNIERYCEIYVEFNNFKIKILNTHHPSFTRFKKNLHIRTKMRKEIEYFLSCF